MTDILGHDCNGRPLRAGDEVVVVFAHQSWDVKGRRAAIIRQAKMNEITEWNEDVAIEVDNGVKAVACGVDLRKLDNHQPAGSFDEVMAGLKQPQGVAQ